MILICAVDSNWKISYGNRALPVISEDLKRFKEKTKDHIVVMGKRTWERMDREKPLEDRINIILSDDKSLEDKGFIVVKSMIDLIETINEINQNDSKEVFIIGGETVLRQLYIRCKEAYITKVYKYFSEEEQGLINLDEDDNWEKVYESDIYNENNLDYQFVKYLRKF